MSSLPGIGSRARVTTCRLPPCGQDPARWLHHLQNRRIVRRPHLRTSPNAGVESQRHQFVSEIVRSGDDEAAELVAGLRPHLDRTATRHGHGT
jgi:hypothetical protein